MRLQDLRKLFVLAAKGNDMFNLSVDLIEFGATQGLLYEAGLQVHSYVEGGVLIVPECDYVGRPAFLVRRTGAFIPDEWTYRRGQRGFTMASYEDVRYVLARVSTKSTVWGVKEGKVLR